MRYSCLLLVFVGLFSACKRGPDKETLELYEAYLEQYEMMNGGFLDYIAQEKVIYKEGSSEYYNYIHKIEKYTQNNDLMLSLNTLMQRQTIDSIQQSYIYLANKIIRLNPYEDAEKYIDEFPYFSGEETLLEQHIKIKQSNLSLLTAYMLCKHRFNCGEQPFLPTPELISIHKTQDSTYYSFIYGIHFFSFFHKLDIENDTLLVNGKISNNISIKKDNGQVILNIENALPGQYEWRGHWNFRYKYGDEEWKKYIKIKFNIP